MIRRSQSPVGRSRCSERCSSRSALDAVLGPGLSGHVRPRSVEGEALARRDADGGSSALSRPSPECRAGRLLGRITHLFKCRIGAFTRNFVGRGFPCCAHLPCTSMLSPLPRRNRRVHLSFSFLDDGGLPRMQGGSASASQLSRPARCSLRVTACWLAELPRSPSDRALQPTSCRSPGCYRLERPLPDRNFTC